MGIIGDNTASPMSFLKPMREGGLEKLGVKLAMDEIFTPPLADPMGHGLALMYPDVPVPVLALAKFSQGRAA